MTLLVIHRHIGPLLGVSVRNESVLLSNAKMRHIPAIFPGDVSLGVIQKEATVLDAELPTASHGLMIIFDAKSVPFGHADLSGLVATGTDGIVDASEARVRNRGGPVTVGPAIGMIGCSAAAA